MKAIPYYISFSYAIFLLKFFIFIFYFLNYLGISMFQNSKSTKDIQGKTSFLCLFPTQVPLPEASTIISSFYILPLIVYVFFCFITSSQSLDWDFWAAFLVCFCKHGSVCASLVIIGHRTGHSLLCKAYHLMYCILSIFIPSHKN